MAERRSRSAPLGQWIAGVGAIVLIASLWTRWYGPDFPLGDFGRPVVEPLVKSLTLRHTGNAWEVFSGADAALFALAVGVAVLTAVAVGLVGPRTQAEHRTIGRLTMLVSIAALAIVVIKLIDQPEPALLIEVSHGAWIGLAGAITMTVGGWLAAQP